MEIENLLKLWEKIQIDVLAKLLEKDIIVLLVAMVEKKRGTKMVQDLASNDNQKIKK